MWYVFLAPNLWRNIKVPGQLCGICVRIFTDRSMDRSTFLIQTYRSTSVFTSYSLPFCRIRLSRIWNLSLKHTWPMWLSGQPSPLRRSNTQVDIRTGSNSAWYFGELYLLYSLNKQFKQWQFQSQTIAHPYFTHPGPILVIWTPG